MENRLNDIDDIKDENQELTDNISDVLEDEFGLELDASSLGIDLLDESAELSSLTDDKDSVNEIVSIISKDMDEYRDFVNAYEESLQVNFYNELKKNTDEFNDMLETVKTTSVSQEDINNINHIYRFLIQNKNEIILQKQIWEFISTIGTPYKSGLKKILDAFPRAHSEAALTPDELEQVTEYILSVKNILDNNRSKSKANLDPDDFKINELRKLNLDFDISKITAVYSVNQVINVSNEELSTYLYSKLDCKRMAFLKDIKVSDADKYKDKMLLKVNRNIVDFDMSAYQIINRNILALYRQKREQKGDVDVSGEVTIIKPFYIIIDDILVILSDPVIYKSFREDIKSELEYQRLRTKIASNVQYIKVTKSDITEQYLEREEFEALPINYRTMTLDEIKEVVEEEESINKIIDDFNIKVIDKNNSEVKTATALVNLENRRTSIFKESILVRSLNELQINKNKYIRNIFNDEKHLLLSYIIKRLLPQVSENPSSLLPEDVYYLTAKNSWFRKLFDNNITTERLKKFLSGEEKYNMDEVTYAEVTSTVTPKNVKKFSFTKKNVFGIDLEEVGVFDISVKSDRLTVSDIKSTHNLIKYFVQIKLDKLNSTADIEKVTDILISYLKKKNITMNERISLLNTFEVTKEADEITRNLIDYYISTGDGSVVAFKDIPFKILATMGHPTVSTSNKLEIDGSEKVNNLFLDIDSGTMNIINQILDHYPVYLPIYQIAVNNLIDQNFIDNMNDDFVYELMEIKESTMLDTYELDKFEKESPQNGRIVKIFKEMLSDIYNENEIKFLLGQINQELNVNGNSLAKTQVKEDLKRFKYDEQLEGFKALVDRKLYTLRQAVFIPITNPMLITDTEYKKLFDSFTKDLERVNITTDIRTNIEDIKERNNLAYKAFLKTGNPAYKANVDLDYVDFDLLTQEKTVDQAESGDYAASKLIEEYDLTSDLEEIFVGGDVDYPATILLAEEREPDIKDMLPKPIVEYVESTPILVPQEIVQLLTNKNSNSKFDIKIEKM